MQGQGVDWTGELLRQEAIQQLVPFDLVQAFERRRHRDQFEMRVRARPGMHVALVQQLQVDGLASCGNLLLDAAFNRGARRL